MLSKHSPVDWHDSNWISALLVLVIILIRAAIRRRIDSAERLILSMAVGWWIGFLVLAIGLRLEMIPGRSANWAGMLGMTIAMWICLARQNLRGVLLASLTTGFIGGVGFAGATLFKLIEMLSGLETNWHSILEQTYGLINGLGVAIAMLQLRPRAPRVSDDPPASRWSEAMAVFFLLIVLTFFNLRKGVDDWIKAKAMLPVLYGLPTHLWYDLLYAFAAVVMFLLLREHMRRPLAVVPRTWLGKAQMLYLALLWWMVTGNFLKAVVAFAPQRMVTEGVITVNALLCSLMALLWAREAAAPPIPWEPNYVPLIKRTVAAGSALFIVSSLACWGIVRVFYGNRFAGNAGHHIRFGPGTTSNKH